MKKYCLLPLLLAASSLPAQVLIVGLADDQDYTPGAASSTFQGYQAGPPASIPFNLSSPLNPAADGTYDDTLPSAVFYGGIGVSLVSGSSSSGANQARFESDNALRWRMSSDSSLGDQAVGVFIWKQADWLDLSSGAGVSVDSFSMTGRKFGENAYQGHDLRFLIEENGQFYISEQILGPASTAYTGFPDADETMALADPASASWFEYDPASDMFGVGSLANPTLTNVTAVGIVHRMAFLDNPSSTITVEYTSFSVLATGSAIPEPSSYVLLVGLVSAVIIWRRRRIVGSV